MSAAQPTQVAYYNTWDGRDGNSFFLRARLSVSLPGVDRAVAEELAQAAHGICPYSKAVHGNIEIATNVI